MESRLSHNRQPTDYILADIAKKDMKVNVWLITQAQMDAVRAQLGIFFTGTLHTPHGEVRLVVSR